MQLSVAEVAVFFDVPEKAIYRWIRERGLPAYDVNGQYHFNRAELLEWATVTRTPLGPAAATEPQRAGDSELPTIADALADHIVYGVRGHDRAAVLTAVVETLRLPERVDRRALAEVLLAREALGSTGVGEGIAIPHPRNPLVLDVERPIVSLCFLAQPIDFGALDGVPVGVLFTLISPTVRGHLHLLSRLAFCLQSPAFKAAVTGRAAASEILAATRVAEASLGAATRP